MDPIQNITDTEAPKMQTSNIVDFHTHILPQLDDGANDETMAIAMLESEVKQGVTDVLFTPHYYGKTCSPDDFLEQRNEAWNSLKTHAPVGLNVYLGAEVHFTGVNVIDYEELCKLAIADTEYILIEFPFTEQCLPLTHRCGTM